MAFYGCEFSFDGIPCFEYGLMVYDFGSTNENGKFSSTVKISEDRTAWRYTPLHYGATQNTPLTFSFTFGADVNSMDKKQHLDRWEMEVIASWLTGHSEYKYLEITQPDMEAVRYKCIISNLEYTTYGNLPWAFKCEVTCDSPFAYLYPEINTFNIADTLTTQVNCRASCKYYYPKLTLKITKGNSFTIINHSDSDRRFEFTNIPAVPITIYVDNENEVITNSRNLNLYNCFNFNFFRMISGYNNFEIIGNAIIDISCEFPINVGG